MIHIKTKEEIEIMREGGRILAKILSRLKDMTKVGVATNELDKLARDLCGENKVDSSFLGFNNFPAALCVSINEEVVHGLPSERILKKGDVVKLDMGVKYKGFHTDSALTVLLDDNDPQKIKLIEVAKKSLEIGISKAVAGNTTGDIGHAIQQYVESEGFNVPRELIGHGVGRELHEAPEVPNYGQPRAGEKLKPGMTIAIEPMVFIGGSKVKEKDQVFVTKDGSLAAHFEHSIAITSGEPITLTPFEVSLVPKGARPLQDLCEATSNGVD